MCIKTAVNKDQISNNILKTDSILFNNKQMDKYSENDHLNTTDPKSAIELDTLAVLTAYQKKIMQKISNKIENFHQSSYYKILFGTTQPAHVISVITVCTVMSLFYKSNPSATYLKTSNALLSSPPSTIITMIYLLAFCTHFGSQFWMTFVSGLSLYFALPRHAFGSVQKVLFPKYFSLNAFLSAVTLISFRQLNHPWSNRTLFQEIVLIICFLLELIVRLYAVPPLIKLISAKTAIESRVGVGQEVGYHDPGPLKNCPHYKELHKTFRLVHLCVAVGNILSLICTTLHLQYLAHHLISLNNCVKN